MNPSGKVGKWVGGRLESSERVPVARLGAICSATWTLVRMRVVVRGRTLLWPCPELPIGC